MDRLEKSQRKVTKILMYRKKCPPDMSYDARLAEFDLLQINDLFQVLRLIFCFKLIKNLGPTSFLQFFHPSFINNDRYLHWTAHTNTFQNSVFVSFPRLWNKLPTEIRSAISLPVFKSVCKDHFAK